MSRASASSAEQLLNARDAHSSATALALLFAATQPIAVVGGVGLPRAMPLGLIVAQTLGTLSIAAYLLATRSHPNRRVAVGVGALFAAFFAMLTAYVAARSRIVGRPFEAFVLPQLLITAFALVAPGLRLGAAALALFVFEGFGIYAWLRLVHTPATQIPVTEPGAVAVCAIVGLTLLLVRQRRRQLALQHVRTSAEVLALDLLSRAFDDITVEIERQLQVVTQGLGRLRAASPPSAFDRNERAVARLAELRHRLCSLASSRPDSADTGDAERRLYAHDAQNGAISVAALAAAVSLVMLLHLRLVLSTATVVYLATSGLVALVLGAFLVGTRQRATERRGIVTAVLIMALFAVVPFLSQPQAIASGYAFEPLIAPKMLALLLPLAVGRRLWLGMTLEAALVGEALFLYYATALHTARDRIPATEPWLTVAYVLIGVGILLASDHRRIAFARTLRADRELSTQARRAGLRLAILDQLGSPLQTLVVGVDLLQTLAPDDPQAHRLADAVHALGALRDRIPALDDRATALVKESFDAAATLRSR